MQPHMGAHMPGMQAGGGEDDEEGTGELGQLEGPDVGFDTHRTTICAGTLLNDSRIVQVLPLVYTLIIMLAIWVSS